MGIQIFVILIFLCLAHASYDCRTSYCEGSNLYIGFPFWLQDRPQQNCTSPGFNLTCPGNNNTALDIPNSGDFYVEAINYNTRSISLSDPNNCLPGRLLSLNLSSSPFKATNYQSYTFLSCPKGQKSFLRVVDCLSNSTSDILATKYQTDVTRFSMCTKIVNLSIPISSFNDDYGYGFPKQLDLTWDAVPICTDCLIDETGNENQRRSSLIMELVVGIPILVVLIVGTSCCAWTRSGEIHRTIQASRRAALPDTTTTTGLDEFTIGTYRKITITSENYGVTGPNDATTCAICLADYKPNDTIRFMPECEHCFHVECIDKWLIMNSQCPICRTLQPRVDFTA